jgi:hypothetical protein
MDAHYNHKLISTVPRHALLENRLIEAEIGLMANSSLAQGKNTTHYLSIYGMFKVFS